MSRQDRVESSSEAVSQPTDAPNATSGAGSGRKKQVFLGVAVLALLAGGYVGYQWWANGRFMIETDDAYVQADTSIISAKLTGYVADIPVAANQHVRGGDVVLRIDDGDYKIALDLARAKLPALDTTLARIDAQVDAATIAVTQYEAQLAAAEAVVTASRTAATRARGLAARKVTSQADLDTANEALATAIANRNAADAAISGAKAQVEVLRAQHSESETSRRQLQLAVDQAQRDLDATVLRAPFDGTIANVAIREGELVSAGARLAAVVPGSGQYVEANYKETQLADIRIGQSARVQVDALDGHVIEGKVISISPATGAMFSLLPPENATGNFTKIVQRVPVRIALPDSAEPLRTGLSVVVEIDTRTGPKDGDATPVDAEK